MGLKLAELIKEYEAYKAQEYFESVFQGEQKDVDVPKIAIKEEQIQLNELLVEIKFASSKSEAKRLIEQGAVKINDEKVTQFNHILDIKNSKPLMIRAGRKLCTVIYRA